MNRTRGDSNGQSRPHIPAYSFMQWDIDGSVRPAASDCEPGLCDCFYERDSVYTHQACLTPGEHTLNMGDALGFGWLGASVSLLRGGVPFVTGTIPSAASCSSDCPLTESGHDFAKCFDRNMRSGDSHLCAELALEGCDCGGCCFSNSADASWWHAWGGGINDIDPTCPRWPSRDTYPSLTGWPSGMEHPSLRSASLTFLVGGHVQFEDELPQVPRPLQGPGHLW